jgi:AbrB family looped-hinge helix DNA binding protein
MRATVVLRGQGRLVVPAEVRKELGLEAGDELVLHTEDGRLVLERRRDAVRRLKGLYTSPATQGSVEELLEDRRQAAATE